LIIGGYACLVLGIIGIVGTIVFWQYDILIAGEDENNIGDTQRMYMLMSAVGTIVLLALGGALASNGWKKRKKAMAAIGASTAATASAVTRTEPMEEAVEPEPEYSPPEPEYTEPGPLYTESQDEPEYAVPEPEPDYLEPEVEPEAGYEAPEEEPLLVYECPECGSPVEEDADMCDTCGVRFAPTDEEVVEEGVVEEEVSITVGKEYPPADIPEEEMPPAYEEAPADRSELYARDEDEGGAVDLDFGEELEEDWDEDDDEEYVYECPECGGEVAEEATICPHCGAEFED
jgi:uncharacterized OB-fold protein